MKVSDLSERELIARIQALLPPAPAWLTVGIGDDGAVVEPERNHLEVFTVDALVEGIHFDRRFTPPDAIGHRALAANLSDLAAMGAAPRLGLLSLALPPSLELADFDGMLGGLTALAARHRLHLVGGNLTRSPGPLVVDLTLVGTVKRRRALTRAGARPGDEVYVTGSIGSASAGLQMLQRLRPDAPRHDSSDCTERYLRPEPRVRTGVLLSRNCAASACMDLSDGLADAIHQVARASGVGMAINGDLIPMEPEAREWYGGSTGPALLAAMTGGDDYELLFTVRPRWRGRLRGVVEQADAAITCIGVCTEEPDVVLHRVENGSASITSIPFGFSHFK